MPATAADQRFPPSSRLRRSIDFQAMRRGGMRLHTPHFLIQVRRGPGYAVRLGITVTKRVAGAVGRNRIKRLVRESFRQRRSGIPPGIDLVVIAKKGATELDFHAVARELSTAWAQIPPP